MKRIAKAGLIIAALLNISAAPSRYALGQVWAYKTRAGDEGSVLKIQQIEQDLKLGPIYHISIIRFHLSSPQMRPEIPHSPVSAETLDASVTHLVKSDVRFPDATPGIEQWRNAKGGIFTIPVAEIVGIIDQQTANVGD